MDGATWADPDGAAAVHAGARNLLENCAGLAAGARLLILVEDPAGGFYDPALGSAVAEAAAALGIEADLRLIPFAPQAADLPPDLAEAMARADRTLFFARLGDQLRFSPSLAALRPVVSYALDAAMLGSGFGRAHHAAFTALKRCVDAALAGARHIRVTCPLGTDFEGPGADFPVEAGEVTVARFPLSVFAPVPAAAYRGRIAQAGFLTGTGSTYYEPYTVPLDDVLTVHFEGNRITAFEGPDACRAAAHYARVGQMLGIRHDFVHSWHAGIHPGCAWLAEAADNPERWSGGAFGNPRLLHFHTCGTYAPGEISLNVVDPTILLDGVALWDGGRLHPERVAGGAEILRQYPCAARAFAEPERSIGLAPSGRLSARCSI